MNTTSYRLFLLLTLIVIGTSMAHGQSDVLFEDSFDRTDSADLNALRRSPAALRQSAWEDAFPASQCGQSLAISDPR